MGPTKQSEIPTDTHMARLTADAIDGDVTGDALPVVWLMLGHVDYARLGDLRWQLHDLLTREPCRVVVDLTDLDGESELTVFAVLVNADRLTHMRASELMVVKPPARFRRAMGVSGLRELRAQPAEQCPPT
ncbi:MAG: hypothetical protein ACJ735_12420 [Actinomycetes bacterium]